jgi:hypothetical protein
MDSTKFELGHDGRILPTPDLDDFCTLLLNLTQVIFSQMYKLTYFFPYLCLKCFYLSGSVYLLCDLLIRSDDLVSLQLSIGIVFLQTTSRFQNFEMDCNIYDAPAPGLKKAESLSLYILVINVSGKFLWLVTNSMWKTALQHK